MSSGCDPPASGRNERDDAGQQRQNSDAAGPVKAQASPEVFQRRQLRNVQGK